MRIQLELSDRSAEQIKRLMKRANIKTYSEFFSNAVAMVNWAAGESSRGLIIVSADEETKTAVTQLAMPLLDAVKVEPARPRTMEGSQR